MAWLDRSWQLPVAKQSKATRRERRRFAMSKIEVLEPRFCLGNLMAPIPGAGEGDPVETPVGASEVLIDIPNDQLNPEDAVPDRDRDLEKQTDENYEASSSKQREPTQDDVTDSTPTESDDGIVHEIEPSIVEAVPANPVDFDLVEYSEDATDETDESDSEKSDSSRVPPLPRMEKQDGLRELNSNDGDGGPLGHSSGEGSGPLNSVVSTSHTANQAGQSTGIATNSISAAAAARSIHNVVSGSDSSQSEQAQTTDNSTNPSGTSANPQPASAQNFAWSNAAQPVTVRYDFRPQDQFANQITTAQKNRAVDALGAWTAATNGKLVFVQDISSPAEHIINIGTGDLAAVGYKSNAEGTLSVGGGMLVQQQDGNKIVGGMAWLDNAETWDTIVDNGDPSGTFDYYTAVAHEIGHALGLPDSGSSHGTAIMDGVYHGEQTSISIDGADLGTSIYETVPEPSATTQILRVYPMMTVFPQLIGTEVETLLSRAAAATASDDAIFAIVDRGGQILGVRVEEGVLDAIDANPALPTDIPRIPTDIGNGMIDSGAERETLNFAIDGAVAKARTAAFFSNGDPDNGTLAPLTSRLVRFISQSTITQREVESNPSITDSDSTIRGPGLIAPIGLGGHFPPDVMHTPPVDLFAIEKTNRDSLQHPGEDRIKGTTDDVILRSRFNIDPTFVMAGQEVHAPESYGAISGFNPDASARGIATLPGGIPIFRDTNSDSVGDTLVGAIGTFFPGDNGFATFEQGFVAGVGQSSLNRTNALRVQESEFIGLAVLGSNLAGFPTGMLDGIAPIADLDLPFGRLDLVGIQLEVIGPIAGIEGVHRLVRQFGPGLGNGDSTSGANQPVGPGADMTPGTVDDPLFADGESVAEGWLVMPHDSAVDPLTAADVRRIIEQGTLEATKVRAAVRLPRGSRTRMVLSVTDTSGEVLGLFRMKDATVFSLDVAVAKARNTAYYADARDPMDADTPGIQDVDRTPGIPAGVAFSNRTFRFLAEPRFPSGVDGTTPPEFSILNEPSINRFTAENIGAAAPASAFTTVAGFDAFHPGSNFRDLGDSSVVADPSNPPGTVTHKANQNGIVFFPGSTPIYKSDVLVGGFGVSGDGVDQDDVVTFIGSQGFLPTNSVLRADQVNVGGVRLPFIKFLRNPHG